MLTGKPALSWLDRLRSSKGFPLTTDLNLDEFLNHGPNSLCSTSVPSNSIRNSAHESRGEEEWFTSVSSVLAELFVMEDEDEEASNNKPQHHKKHSRKQTNPKVCIFAATSPSSADNSVAEVKKEEKKSEKLNLSGFTRSDLVIIDTSGGVWKTEKRVTRKGNVWKVRETKRKAAKLRSLLVCKKKRKFKEFDEESCDEIKKKTRIVKKKKQKISLSSIQKGCDNQVATEERQQHDPDQVCIKRWKFFGSLGKPMKRSCVSTAMNNVE